MVARRVGGAVASDRFSVLTGAIAGLDPLDASGSDLQRDGTTVAQVTDGSATGTLVVAFTAGASVDDVRNVLRRVAYANVADAQTSPIDVQVTFVDGNAGAQGSGGALASDPIGFEVSVANVNDAPSFTAPVTLALDEDVADGAERRRHRGHAAGQRVRRRRRPSRRERVRGRRGGRRMRPTPPTEGVWRYSTDAGATWSRRRRGARRTPSLALADGRAPALRPRPRLQRRGPHHRRPRRRAGPTHRAARGRQRRARPSRDGASRELVDATTVDATSDVGSVGTTVGAVVAQVNDAPAIVDLGSEDYSIDFVEAVGVNVAGVPIRLDTVGADNPDLASVVDVELTERGEATFDRCSADRRPPAPTPPLSTCSCWRPGAASRSSVPPPIWATTCASTTTARPCAWTASPSPPSPAAR
ncbi:MAG: hypothetical protein U5J97_11645 [Trueperaceae bacterium]|nr:hypothetical protein [Trueperaceae bacterium]